MSFFSKNKSIVSRNSYLLVTAAWLITISFIIDNYWSGTSTISTVHKRIQSDVQKHQEDFASFCTDTVLITQLTDGSYPEETLEKLTTKEYYIFIYNVTDSTTSTPLFWNTQVIEPPLSIISMQGSDTTIKLSNGWYVMSQDIFKNAGHHSFRIISLMPVKWEYYISNNYLHNSFTALDKLETEYRISVNSGKKAVEGIGGKTLFYLDYGSANIVPHNNAVALWLRILGALFVLLFIHVCANYYVSKKGFIYGALMLIIPVVLLRLISYFLPIPLNFSQLELFDPSIYGSGFFLRSLGDLLINSLLFVWIILFLRYHISAEDLRIKTSGNKLRVILLIAIALGMIFITIICAHIVKSLVAYSQISFDVTNFFTLDIYSVVGFFVLCCIAAGYFFFFQILLYMVNSLRRESGWVFYIIIAVTGLAVLTLRLNSSNVAFDLAVIFWLLLYLFVMNYDALNLLGSKLIASRFIFWVFFFSVSITAVIVFQNTRKELNARKHFAENLSNRSDPSGERMMNIVLTDFRNDFLTNVFYRFNKREQNKFLKDSLINESTSGYLNKYDTRIYTFDAGETPLFNEDSANFHTLNTVIETQARPTSIAGLYYYDVAFDRFNYISKKEVIKDSTLLGYVFIVSRPKQYKSDALYPELFSKGNANAIESSPLYAFAIYNHNLLSSSYNDYSFPTELGKIPLPSSGFWERYIKGYHELWYKASPDKVVVITKQDAFFIESITLFAYLFCLFLLISVIFRLMNMLVQSKFNMNTLRNMWQLTIRNQVHGTIILISIFSFLVIGVVTILFFISRYHNNNREKLSRTIHVMENEVRTSLDRFSADSIPTRLFDPSSESLDQTINRIAEIHAADINLYDLKGDLRTSSLPLPYNKGIVSKRMDPVAYYHLNKQKDVQYFQEQKIGRLTYLSNYVPVRDQSGKEYAYLNIPYFESQSKLQEEISNFLVTIINLNAFIFLIAGIIALFITNRITRSFSLISSKMKEVNLGQVNEEISWHRQDEIGDLVNEFNKMVKKLDTSAEMLARSEREGAWREMARQVAHEIKNPLTPMKLNLQYLQMAIDNNSPKVKEISVYVSKILVEQIDHLSQIAGDFAQFANIGQSHNMVFNLNDSLDHVTSLYSTNERLEIVLKTHKDNILINADKTQINRLFTNLLQNAIQSVPEKRKAKIVIGSYEKGDKVTITVTDNGTGIPEEMSNKIFTPNFTTKTSGTGLGLAMCKGIVEKSNGRIWFETVVGEQTTFFVELPMVE